MAKDNGRPEYNQVELDAIAESLRVDLQGGISIHKACSLAGVSINTVKKYMASVESFRRKIEAYQSHITSTLSYITTSILDDMKKAIVDAKTSGAPVRKLFDKDELQFMRTVAMYNRSVRNEWGNDTLPEGDSPEQPSFTAPRNEVEAELQIMVLNKHADYVRAKQKNRPVDDDSAET